MIAPTAADLDWLIETFDKESHSAESEFACTAADHAESETERVRARQIVDSMREMLAEEAP